MVEVDKKVSIMNENSKIYFILNFPIAREGENNKKNLLTKKFGILDACQDAWFKCYGIKKSTLYHYKNMFINDYLKSIDGNSGLKKN